MNYGANAGGVAPSIQALCYIHVIFGVALVILAASLHWLLGRDKSLLMAIATPFGLIWSGLVIASGMVANVGLSAVSAIYAISAEEAANAWAIIGTIQDRVGGELVGGIWVLLRVDDAHIRIEGSTTW
ncbi:MAG: hypothetical protein CME39_04195 [Haliea sp.]|nr:hypothetical protein [Haliea sp.]|tara:strand:- start:10430 stop:10813 length:384 start_codon:yes stop_codon:yes gene_type:complete